MTTTSSHKITSYLAAPLALAITLATICFTRPAQANDGGEESLRAQYHLTPPDHWLSDPQRPIYQGGKYNLYYLYSNPNNSPGGWRHATTTDNVTFNDKGISIPLTNGIPAWTGSTVIDENNTAGFGSGAIIALTTQPTQGDRYQQEQYLWYSTDGGDNYIPYGEAVIKNQAILTGSAIRKSNGMHSKANGSQQSECNSQSSSTHRQTSKIGPIARN